jgi:hypothetical protein
MLILDLIDFTNLLLTHNIKETAEKFHKKHPSYKTIIYYITLNHHAKNNETVPRKRKEISIEL